MSDRVIENIRQRWHGPCSPCGDGDVNLEYHSHEPTKTAIVITLDNLDTWAREYLEEMGGNGQNDIAERLTLSSFIHWLRRQRQEKTNAKSKSDS